MRVRLLIARGADVNVEGAAAESDGVDVGGLRTSRGGRAHPHRARRRPRGTDEKGILPRCTSRRAKAISKAPVCCWPLVSTSTSGRAANAAGERRRKPKAPVEAGGPSYEASVSAGSTPLLVATVRAQVPLALFLLDQGADPNIADAGLYAAALGRGHVGERRSQPGVRVHRRDERHSDRQAKLELVKALLARGANPNARMTQRPPGFAGGYTDVVGATPFLLAAATADIELMRLLLAAGADPQAIDKEQHDGNHGGGRHEPDAR